MFSKRQYGYFDPKFIGITICSLIEGDRISYEYYNSVITNNEARTELAKQLLLMDDQEAFDVYSRCSSVVHELRHFHDYILTPIGSSVIRKNISAVYNGIQCFAKISHRSELQVPLNRFLKTFEEEYIRSQFHITHEDYIVMKMVEESFLHIQTIKLNDFVEIGDLKICSNMLYEASAILCQIAFINDLFGNNHAIRFKGIIETSSDFLEYNVIFKLIDHLFDLENRSFNLSIAGLMIHWSLLTILTDEEHSKASRRFMTLWSYLREVGLPIDDFSCLEVIDEWDRRLATFSLRDALHINCEMYKNTYQGMKELNHSMEVDEGLFKMPENMAGVLYDLNKQIVELLEKDIQSYVDPVRYLDLVRALPDVYVANEIVNGGLCVTKRFTDSNIPMISAQRGERVFVSKFVSKDSLGQRNEYNIDLILDYYTWSCIMKYLFDSDDNWRTASFEATIARQSLANFNITFQEMF